MKKLLFMAICAVSSTALLAAEKKVTLDVTGAVCGGCGKALTSVLGEGGLKVEGKLTPSKKDPARVEATAAEDVDLGAVAAKLAKTEKPHADPPGALAVVLFASMDTESAKKAEEALGKVKGVDKKGIKADDKKGEISVKIAGDEKITVPALVNAVKLAGVNATTTKEKAAEKKA